MLYDAPCKCKESLEVDGLLVNFSLASDGTKVSMHALHALLGLITQQLGDYGYFTDSGRFFSQGNLFSDFKSLISEANITPEQKEVTGSWGFNATSSSLPNNPTFNSFLASLAPRLTNSYLVTRIIQRPGESRA